MFVEINGTPYNMYAISSFRPIDRSEAQSDGTSVDYFYIVYATTGGTELWEKFTTADERNAKYDKVKAAVIIS